MGPEILISSANESRDQHGNNMTTPTTVLFLSIFFYASSSDCYMETFSQPVDILWVWVKFTYDAVRSPAESGHHVALKPIAAVKTFLELD